jgi:N-acetylmuramic acid 6-phosphate etherase
VLNDREQPAADSTEARSEATRDLDRMSVEEGLALLASEFRRPFDAFEDAAVELTPIVEAVVRCIRRGGNVHLFGAGTSGRIAALDTAEIPPTFGLAPSIFRAHLAGGESALTTAVEDAEDDTEAGARAGAQLKPGDIAIGLTASGSTPYVLAALAAARSRAAFTALIACNTTETPDVDYRITLATGPEPIAGSTRLNAATAQKLALNAISTLAMIRLGRTYSNLMVCLRPNNAKLRTRLAQMVRDVSGADEADVDAALAAADNRGGVALAMLMRGWTVAQAERALEGGAPLRVIVDGDIGPGH